MMTKQQSVQKFDPASGRFVDVDETTERQTLMRTVASQINNGSKLTIIEANRLYGFKKKSEKFSKTC